MIGYYKTAIDKASLLLHMLRVEPDNLPVLLELQRFLVQKIRQSERNILRLKSSAKQLKTSLRRDRLPKDQARAVKAKIKAAYNRVEQYKHLIFIWKCYGDGIANIYLCKYALKHTFYSVEDYAPKENAGFLTGKEGFRLEWAIIRKSIEQDHAVLLCDITNVLRHGDVCLMLDGDPSLAEIKSSKNRNARVDRQQQHLQALHKFYVDDGADDFRGVPSTRRQAFDNEEVNHTEALNACIERSYSEGMATVSPEPGVHYLAVFGEPNDKKLSAVMTKVMTNSSMVFMLNETKSEGTWMPYYPFTLSIHPQHLYHFIRGNLSLIVVIDLKVLKNLFKSHGVHATVINDGTSFLQISKDLTNFEQGVIRVSEHLFLRVALEFQSIEWFAEECSRFLDTGFGGLDSEQGWLSEIPESWFSVSDGLDDI